MLPGYSPVTQALLGTLFTWGLTAAGAALVFIFSSRQAMSLKHWPRSAPAGPWELSTVAAREGSLRGVQFLLILIFAEQNKK
ncbi:hypothetical protein CRUP_033407 [Coryphaenoides rupestris]|nr:hypothetical protein CRUP_033407 [Coryphaenoides rupestris]